MAQQNPNWMTQLKRLKVFENYSTSTYYDGLVGAESLGFISKLVQSSKMDKLK